MALFIAANVDAKTIGVDVVNAFARNDYDAVEAWFDDAMKRAAPANEIASTWSDVLAQAGEFVGVDGVTVEPAFSSKSGKAHAIVKTIFRHAVVEISLTLDDDGRVAGFHFVNWLPPVGVEQRTLTIGTKPFEIGATIAMPASSGSSEPIAAVVLVPGSGPNDRDENIERNHPFRDLAWGLAQRGVASIRFDKRTKTHGAQLAKSMATFTLKDEEIDDAIAAYDAVAHDPRVDAKRVFIVGHSLGGWVAPRIAQATHAAGIVGLAAPSRRFGDVVLDQVRFQRARLGWTSFLAAPNVWMAARQAKHLADRAWIEAHDDDEIVAASVCKAYWLDDLDHDPVAIAKSLSVPMLFLRGDADFQVFVADLDGWQRALADHANVHVRQVQGLNHLFIASTTQDASDYKKPGAVDARVLDQIAAFVVDGTMRD